jgi:hypothetical protein
LQTKEYDDSSYDPLGTLLHTDRENRAMASVFSYYERCFHYSSDRDDHLVHSPRAGHCFHSPHHIPDSSLTVELIRLLLATIAKPFIRNTPHPFMEARQLTPTCP